MSSVNFTKTELAAAFARGVRQFVVIGSRPPFEEDCTSSPDAQLQVFAVGEEPPSHLPSTFVPTQFASEALATALDKSNFDKLKASLFVWLGGAGYRTIDAVMASLAFIGTLPSGSGVVFDYAEERGPHESATRTALDALASRMFEASGSIKQVIQPQAVAAMLRGLGFQRIVDFAQEELPISGRRFVSAVL